MSPLSKALADRKNELDEGLDTITERARDAGYPIDRSTVHRYLTGKIVKRPPDRVIKALAAGFRMRPQVVRSLAEQPIGEDEPWIPPDVAARLDHDVRSALDKLIRAIARTGGPQRNGHRNDQESDGVHTSADPAATNSDKTRLGGTSGEDHIDAGWVTPPARPLRGDDEDVRAGKPEQQHQAPPSV